MKTQNFKPLPLLLIILLSITSLNLVAQNEQERPRKDRHGPRALADNHPKIMQIPDLTDNQKEQIKKIRTQTQKQNLPTQNMMREKKARLTTLSTVEKANINEINKVIEEIGELQTGLMKARQAARQEIRNLLNDEQRVFFDTRMQVNHRKRHQKRGRG